MSSVIPISLSNGKTLNIQIKNSNRAKQLWLKANIYGMYIVVPTTLHYEINDILNFIYGKKKWLQRQFDYYERLKRKYDSQDIFKVDGHDDSNTISFLGTRYLFNLIKDKTTHTIISDNLKKISFHVNDKRKYKDYIKKWYRRQTARIIANRLPLIIINKKMNLLLSPIIIEPFHYNKISVKEQKSRWASCSTKRNLNFNLFLAALPVEIIDYVIIHELVHLVELNHSKNFWDLVGLADPEYKKHREWLHRYGSLVKIP
jgi:predicted metal-dependent hydrolase